MAKFNTNFDAMAKRIFSTAIDEDRCGELLEALFDGASATVDPEGKLIIFPASALPTL